jgi:hypothetical protein
MNTGLCIFLMCLCGALRNHGVAIIVWYFAHKGTNDRRQLALEGVSDT